MFARHKVRLLRLRAPEHLVQSVELGGFGVMAQVASVDDELGLIGQPIDLFDRRLKRSDDVGVGRLVKAHVTVADLHEVKSSLRGLRVLAESLRTQNAAANGPGDASPGPSHTLQKSTTVDAVVIVVVSD